MGGSEYRNTANKINIIDTPTPRDLPGLNVSKPLLLLFKHKKHIPTAFSACKIPCCRFIINEV